MVGGLALQHFLSLPALLLLGLSACSLALLAGSARYRSSAGIYMAVLLLAASYSAVESVQTPSRAALTVAEVLFEQQEILGTVCDDPALFENDDAVVFRFKVESVYFKEGWRPADAEIRVRLRGPARVPSYGERWCIVGRFRSYNPGFSGLAGALYADCDRATCVREASPSLRGACYRMRRQAAAALSRGLEDFPQQARLLQALLLGYRHELPRGLQQIFSQTGTLHIFAISGLHVGVMAAILIAFFKVAGLSRPRWGLFLIPILFLYVVSTGMKPSAFRAFTMAAVYFMAPLVRRRSDTASAIALAAIVLLAINPFQLSDPGFLLSFTVVCGIVMVHSFAAQKISVLRLTGRAAWSRLGGPAPLAAFGRTVTLLAVTSLAAWLFSAPLTARFFNTVSPVAPVGNLLIIPLTFLIVLTGCFSLLAATVSVAATVVFNHANRIFVSFLITFIERVGAIPGAYSYVRAPSAAAVVCWYGGLVLACAGPPRLRKPGVLLVCCAAGFWAAGLLPSRAHSGVEVLRDADTCVLIQVGATPQALCVKGDAYSLTRASRFLKQNGVNRLPHLAIIGTWIDDSGIEELCRIFSVGQIWMCPQAASAVKIPGGPPVHGSERLHLPCGDGAIWMELTR
jgi:ComEC/Rec2-related protein